MSTRDEVVADIQQLAGWRTDKSTEIVTALQRAQTKYETGGGLPELPWFLLSEITTSNTTVSEERLAVPSDFLREHDDGTLWRYNASAEEAEDQYINLPKSDYDALVGKYGGATGTPLYYALVGGYFRLKPVPDAVYPIKMIYYAKDTALTSNVENNWLLYCPDVLEGEAGYRMCASFRDKEGMAIFSDMRDRGLAALQNANEARKHENQRYVIGGED